jgi:two-component system cell cycle response regulator DivK
MTARHRILVVEDNELNMKLIRAILVGTGKEILEATDGESAIEIARRERPDLVLMDVQLPKMSGLEATEIMKADPDLAAIPIVAMTAYALKGDREKILDAGCDGYVAKPIDTRAFPALLDEYLDGSKS